MADEGVYVFHYDVLGRNDQLTYADGHVREQHWDSRGRLDRRCYRYPAAPGVAPRCYTAEYDDAGVPTRLTDPESEDVIAADLVDRLDHVQSTRRRDGQVSVEDYEYNLMGALKVNANTVLDTRRPRRPEAGGGSADAAIPSNVEGDAVSVYYRGEIVDIGSTHLTPNDRGDFTRMSSPTATHDFSYGPTGELFSSQRVGDAGARYVYDDDNALAYTSLSGEQVSETFLYAGVDHPLRMKRGSMVVYYELDLAGNVRRLRGTGGAE